MKKMLVSLVAMLTFTATNANCSPLKDYQDTTKVSDKSIMFERMSKFLELRINQVELVKKAMSQLEVMTEAAKNAKDAETMAKTYETLLSRHYKQMRQILDDKQYEKYLMLMQTTIQNGQ